MHEIYTELKLEMPFIGNGGTLDVGIYDAEKEEAIVADHKFGRGIRYADDPQLWCYGFAFMDWLQNQGKGVLRVKLAIIQPRINHFDTVVMTNAEMTERMTWLRDRAEATRADNPEFTPGEEQCQWCLGKATCPALRGVVADTVDTSVFTDVDAPVESPEAMAADKAAIPLIRKWCDAREAAINNEAVTNGVPIQGFKVVKGRLGNASWADPDEALKLLNGKFRMPVKLVCDHKVKSPTNIRKLFKELKKHAAQTNQMEALITRKQGTNVLVPESDKREAIPSLDVFTNADEEKNDE